MKRKDSRTESPVGQKQMWSENKRNAKSTVSGKSSSEFGGEAWEVSYRIMKKERKRWAESLKKKNWRGRPEVGRGKNVIVLTVRAIRECCVRDTVLLLLFMYLFIF